MKKASKPAPSADPVRKQAVIYARVSSKEQEKEGFSIPAHLKLLKEYAAANGLAMAQEYVDVETAKQTGRTAFGEMVAFLKANRAVRAMLVEKTDRLYRNLKDWVTIDELDVEMHFAKEGVVLSRESRSSEKFMHGIKVLMAKNYIDNLSEEARKGMQEKAEQGIWPTKTPLGYRNITGPDGKKIIAIDPTLSPIVAKLFEWYARGDISLKEVARKAQTAGLLYPKTGAKVPVSTVHTILRNRLYTGWFEWNGKLIKGKHEALVPVELWERAQGVLDGRFAKKAKRGRHDFAFSGLIACHACGCAVVGEIKKERYTYYHCTGYADKCQGNPASCRRKYVREEALEAQFTELLGCLKFDDEVLDWVRDALHASHATNAANMKRRSSGIRLNTSGFRIASTPCMSTSSMVSLMRPFSRKCRTNGVKSRAAAFARLSGTKMPINLTWTRVYSFWSWPATPKGCSRSRNLAKNAAFSISYYRTARGRMAM
jgi:DNA invertase Pin-like site-specific DNA recombinase